MNHSNLGARLRFGALPAAIAVSLMPTLAGAQEAGEKKEATNLDRIEVTGSRIKRADIETSQPTSGR